MSKELKGSPYLKWDGSLCRVGNEDNVDDLVQYQLDWNDTELNDSHTEYLVARNLNHVKEQIRSMATNYPRYIGVKYDCHVTCRARRYHTRDWSVVLKDVHTVEIIEK